MRRAQQQHRQEKRERALPLERRDATSAPGSSATNGSMAPSSGRAEHALMLATTTSSNGMTQRSRAGRDARPRREAGDEVEQRALALCHADAARRRRRNATTGVVELDDDEQVDARVGARDRRAAPDTLPRSSGDGARASARARDAVRAQRHRRVGVTQCKERGTPCALALGWHMPPECQAVLPTNPAW